MMRRGSILLFSLIVMAMTLIMTGALSSYYVNTSQVAQFYTDTRSTRRVGAARALRKTLESVVNKYASLSDQTQGSTSSVGVALNIKGKTMDEILVEMQKVVPKTTKIENETYQLKSEIVGETALRISVYYQGVEIMNVTIELENPQVLQTLGVFDYVYFVDNNGQLNSNYIIANGEVGTNGDLSINGATVNGYIRYLGSLTLSGQPRAWLQGAYNSKIAAEFKVSDTSSKEIEQARPTNPSVYTENGSAKSVEWAGGYEPPFAKNPYTWDEKPPEAVANPGSAPSAPPKVQYKTTTSETRPTSGYSDYN